MRPRSFSSLVTGAYAGEAFQPARDVRDKLAELGGCRRPAADRYSRYRSSAVCFSA